MNNHHRRLGILYVLSAPSGAGKTTLLQGLRRAASFTYNVSCTTRAPRPNEVNGADYYFLSETEFARRVEAGEFLEHAEVHGKRYGTPLQNVVERLENGEDVLIDIDTAGAAQIRHSPHPVIQNALCDVFVMPPSLAELRRRLEERGTEDESQIALRVRNAEAEMRCWREYRYTIISASREADLANFLAIIQAEPLASHRWQLDELLSS